jgi:serine/threonine-protein kinase
LSYLLEQAALAGENPPEPIVAAILHGVLAGLHAAHEAADEHGRALHLVHRDVSPSNILVGADGGARLLDFGVAKARGRVQTTREGQLKGKLAYMAPEQLLRATIDRRTDLYACAIVCWEALTGLRLFSGESEGEIVQKVLNEVVAPPSAHVPALSRVWDDFVERGLRRSRHERFGTAREMALALERCGPAAPPERVADWVHGLAEDLLCHRARQVAAVEQGAVRPISLLSEVRERPSRPNPPVDASDAEQTALSGFSQSDALPANDRRGLVKRAGAAAVLLAILGGLVLVQPGLTRASRPLLRRAAPGTALAMESASTVLPRDGVALAVAAPSADAPGNVPAPAARSRVKRARRNPCAVPYTRDAAGIKRYKRECL